MRDLDSAVGRLDNILMSVYVIVVIIIFAVSLVRVTARLIHQTRFSDNILH